MTGALEILRWAAAFFVALSLLAIASSVVVGLFAARAARRRPRRSDTPSLSFVVPIKDWDSSFDPAQESLFVQDYPDFDVTVTAAEADSSAVTAARRILAGHPEVTTKIVRSTARFAASPKVDNLYQAVEDASHDLIATKDSNIVLPSGVAREAVAAMTDDVGLVTAITEASDPRGFPAEIECSLMNQGQARVLYAAAALGLGFGLGKLMMFRRSDLRRVGGFEAIAHSVGEDSAMAHALESAGLRTVIIATPLKQPLGYRSFHDVFHRQLRWTVIRRHNELPAFLVEPFNLSVCAGLAAAFAAPLFGWAPSEAAFGTLAVWFGFETLLALARGWDVSMSAPAIMIARDAMMLGVWVRAWFTKRVKWAAEVYDAHRESGPLPVSANSAATARKRNDT
jgi:ceramide glucosyltransferase